MVGSNRETFFRERPIVSYRTVFLWALLRCFGVEIFSGPALITQSVFQPFDCSVFVSLWPFSCVISPPYERAHTFLEPTEVYYVDFPKFEAKWNFYEMSDTVQGIGLARPLENFLCPCLPWTGPDGSVCRTLTNVQAGLTPCLRWNFSPFAVKPCALQQVA